jgi:hypothetical protein
MEIQSDFKELLASLNAHQVEYVIVGGYALAFHGAPRYTGDLDLLVRPEPANARRLLAALDEFGFGSLDLAASDFTSPETVLQLGFAPVRIDFITSLTGVSWEEAYQHRLPGRYGGVEVWYLGREQLIANKRALGRGKDLADLEALEVDRKK